MQDELDRLIAGYSAAEPLTGFEERILQRVRAVETTRKRRRWWALLAIPAAAAIAVALLPAPPRPGVAPKIEAKVVTPEPPVAVQPAPPVRRARHVRAVPREPKREYFPTLAPLSREEHLLLQVARAQPELLLAPPAAAEIRIEPIEIAPLNPNGRQ